MQNQASRVPRLPLVEIASTSPLNAMRDFFAKQFGEGPYLVLSKKESPKGFWLKLYDTARGEISTLFHESHFVEKK